MSSRALLPAAERPYARALAARLTAAGRLRPVVCPIGRPLHPYRDMTCHACGERFIAAGPLRLYCQRGCKEAVRLLMAREHLVRT